jgi:hypothetical protein
VKTIFILLFTLGFIFFSKGYSQTQPDSVASKTPATDKASGPVATWDKTTDEMVDIPQGIPRMAEFKLTNDGTEPLQILSAQASCGCTHLNFSNEPILPGKSTSVTATYNAASTGPFTKSITISTNASEKPTVLWIRGNVLEKIDGQKP